MSNSKTSASVQNQAGSVCAWLLLACALTACGAGPNGGMTDPPPPPQYNTISGTVSFKGAPLAGVTVTNFLTNNNLVFAVATTDANGNYSFSSMSTTGDVPGDYQIYANKTGFGFFPVVGSGAQVIRQDYTGQFQGAGIAPSGLFFTVINFISLPNSSVSGATFDAYDGSNPRVVLAATGQRVSYATGDDASAAKGMSWNAATRFTDNHDGTVTDTLTGLIWLKDAGCLGSGSWAAALAAANNLASGSCSLADNSSAGQWRLPNLAELESLIDASSANPSLPAGNPFPNVSNGIYWSSTSYYGGETGSPDAWTIRMSDGAYVNDGSANVKLTSSNAIWAVRGAAGGSLQLQATGFYVPYSAGDDGSVQSGVRLDSPRFIDNANGTVTDTMTGLVWLKQANCINNNWAGALASVNALASGQCGLTDGSSAGQWRMPNRNELESLSDRGQTNLAQYFNYTYLNKDNSVFQSPIFTNYIELQYYWTSTTDAADTTQAWTVFSCDWGVYSAAKTNLGYTLAVR